MTLTTRMIEEHCKNLNIPMKISWDYVGHLRNCQDNLEAELLSNHKQLGLNDWRIQTVSKLIDGVSNRIKHITFILNLIPGEM